MDEPGWSTLALCFQNPQAWDSCSLPSGSGTHALEDLVTARLVLEEKCAGPWPQALHTLQICSNISQDLGGGRPSNLC